MTEQELLVDCLRRLNRLRISYMLTGSMASNFWGIPRTTHDLDFVVQFPPEAAARIAREFEDGFFIDEPAIRGAFEPPHMFNARMRTSDRLSIRPTVPGSRERQDGERAVTP